MRTALIPFALLAVLLPAVSHAGTPETAAATPAGTTGLAVATEADVAIETTATDSSFVRLYHASEVVVTADRPRRFSTFIADPVLVDGEVDRALLSLPHAATGSYGTATFPSVRGLPTEHVAIEYDGVPLNSIQNGLFDLALLGAFDTSATLMRGPFARLRTGRPGQAAVSITPTPYERGDAAQEGRAVGTFGETEETVRLSYSGERFSLSAGILRDDGYAMNTAVSRFAWEAQAHLGSLDQATHVGVTEAVDSGGRGYRAALSYVLLERDVPGPDYAPGFSGELRDELMIFRVVGENDGSFRPTLYAVRQWQEYEDSYSSPTHITSCAGAVAEYDLSDLLVSGMMATASLDISDLDSWDTVGADLGRHRRAGGALVASYVGGTDAYRFTGEMAATYTSDFAAALSWTCGAAVLRPEGRAWISAGTTWRAPTMNELHWPEDIWSGGNSDLEPERVLTGEAGVSAAKGPLEVSFTLYASRARDLIVWAGDDSFVWRPGNIGEAGIAGAEWDVELGLGSLGLSYGLDLASAVDMKTGKSIPYRPRALHWYRARLALPFGSMGVGVKQSGRVFTDTENLAMLDGYVVTDATLRVMTPVAGMGVLLEVTNLADEQYATRDGYGLPGREWRVGLEFVSTD